MHPNAELIERFYRGFRDRNAAAMGGCYHLEVVFDDEVFTNLKGWHANAMWQMLCERGKDLRVEYRDIVADDARGSAHWEAWYTFTATGRSVHNVIDAEFEFRDGLIARHVDRFDFPAWAAQALGFKGRLLGRTAFLRRAVHRQAAKGLADFIQKRGLGPPA